MKKRVWSFVLAAVLVLGLLSGCGGSGGSGGGGGSSDGGGSGGEASDKIGRASCRERVYVLV